MITPFTSLRISRPRGLFQVGAISAESPMFWRLAQQAPHSPLYSNCFFFFSRQRPLLVWAPTKPSDSTEHCVCAWWEHCSMYYLTVTILNVAYNWGSIFCLEVKFLTLIYSHSISLIPANTCSPCSCHLYMFTYHFFHPPTSHKPSSQFLSYSLSVHKWLQKKKMKCLWEDLPKEISHPEYP